MWCIVCGWSVSDDGVVYVLYAGGWIGGVVFLVRHRSRGDMYVCCMFKLMCRA